MKTKLFLSLMVLALFCSCKKFLDQVPETARSQANFFKTTADFNNATIAAYASLKSGGLYGNGSGALFTLFEIVSDNADFGVTRQPINLGQFEVEDFNISISNTLIASAWLDHYAGIGKANTIIGRLPSSTLAQADKDRFEGEAKFLRALYYFNLVRLFGDVQLIAEEINDPYTLNQTPRTAASEVYKLIISDLQTAEANLPATIPASLAGRASRWAAKALLGKVYLTQGNWTAAATKLKEVIDNSGRSLMSNYAQVFAFNTPYASNTEVLLAVQYKSGQIGQGSNLWSEWAPFNAGAPLLGVGGGNGGGFCRPTLDMVNAYESGDARRAASVATSYMNGSTTVNERFVVKYRHQGALGGDADTDFPLLRYADVLLMYAEALNESGQPGTAETYLNQVRARAALAPKNGLSQADMRLAIEQERRVELAFECHRWPDLVRTNRYLPVMTAKGFPTKDFHKFYPIPQRERDLNNGLTQNPGY